MSIELSLGLYLSLSSVSVSLIFLYVHNADVTEDFVYLSTTFRELRLRTPPPPFHLYDFYVGGLGDS